MDRRTFLKLAGCAVAAPSLMVLPDARAGAIEFLSKGVSVGPLYDVPEEWFSQAHLGTMLSGSLTVENWPGPSCLIDGLRLFRVIDGLTRWVCDVPVKVSSMTTPGDTLCFPYIRITKE